MTTKSLPSMSVSLESTILVKIPGCKHKHRLTLAKARDLHGMLGRYIAGSEQSEGVDKARIIQACVIDHFGLHEGTFMSAARDEVYSWPRHLAIFLTREMLPELTTATVANIFQRERSTISYAEKEARDRIATNQKSKLEVDTIRAKLMTNGHSIV